MSLWDKISYLGVVENQDLSERRTITLTNRLIYFAFSSAISIIPLLYFLNIKTPILPSFIMSALSGLLFILAQKSYHQLTLLLSVIIQILYVITLNTLQELFAISFIADILHLFLIPVLLSAIVLIKNIKNSILLSILIVSTYIYIEYLKSKMGVQKSQITTPFLILYIFDVLAIFGSTFYYINQFKSIDYGYAQDILKQQTEIEEQHKKLTKAHLEMQASIDYAKNVQSALFPSKEILDHFFNDYFIYFKPKDNVAGDFYWTGKNKEFNYFAVADCTGHGVPGALVSLVCINALNRSINEFKLISTNKILDKTREIVIKEFNNSCENVSDGMDIALIRLPNKIDFNKPTFIEFSGAYNPLYIIRNQKPIKFKGCKQPIGNHLTKQPFNVLSFEIYKGDCFYLFSDGYSDQFGGLKGKKLKSKPFEKLLLKNSILNMKNQKKVIKDFHLNWVDSTEQVDDICVFGLKV